MAHNAAPRPSWVERTEMPEAPAAHQEYEDIERHARSHGYHDHASFGISGHFVHMGAMLFPVLAAELITDAEKYKKTVRIGSVLTTVLYEGLYTFREAQRRHKMEAERDACCHEK